MDAMSPRRAGGTVEQPRTIFIVDDDDAVRDSLLVLLHSEGYAAVGFDSCAAALAAIERAAPACLILDLHLPRSGGLELLEALAIRAIVLPTLLISGHIDRPTRQRALRSGADAVLEKPLVDDDLIATIQRICVTPHA